MGEGGLDLLAAIAAHRSLTRAAREVKWSYRHAWGYLRRAERVLGLDLTRPVGGRGAARGTVLTEAGERLLQRLETLRRLVRETVGSWRGHASDHRSRPHDAFPPRRP